MINKALTLTIIIPVYNEERHLKVCLDAIAQQTIQPVRVLVVDNNSTDKTLEIAKKYPFVEVLHEKQQGVVYARNKGFNAVESGIIGRIDADTILPKDWAERVLEFYQDDTNSNSALSGGCYFYNIRLPYFYGWTQGQIAFRTNALLLGHYITFGSNMALPSTLWNSVKDQLCSSTDVHEDLDLAIHLHRNGFPIVYEDSLKVGVKMRRVRTERDQLWKNLMLWPETLKSHGLWTWIFGWIGACMLYAISPVGNIMEKIARFFGRKPIKD